MYLKLKSEVSNYNAQLIAVSKTKPNEAILDLYEKGQRVFGENRVQELVGKYDALPKDIEWHQIGHLQRNKVKYIAPFVHLIHAVDSLELLVEINKQALKNNRVIDCLLQFHIAEEASKFGLTLSEAETLLQSDKFKGFKNIRIKGVMGMATFTDDKAQVRAEFKTLKAIQQGLKTKFSSEQHAILDCSMGMSGDYSIALEEGSTMIRVGSLLFGQR
jgi:pyridoxal phosphate enzyme (YggS family)